MYLHSARILWRMKLNSYLGTVLWEIVSAITVYAAAIRTNKRCEEERYCMNRKNIYLFLMVLAVSLLTGTTATGKSGSVEMWIVLVASYMAVLAAAVFDYMLYIIPNIIPCFLIGCKILVIIYEVSVGKSAGKEIISSVAGCAICFMMLTIAGFFSYGGVGKGDVKLLSALGFSCGLYPTIVTLIAALLCCTAAALLLIGLKKVSWKEHLPFGPFIFLGYVIMICYI